jgi:hypothetical protein
MRRLHFTLLLAGGLVLLVSLPATWWHIGVVGGGVIPVTGLELSALGSTLVAVAVAGVGASLLLRGIPRRLSVLISAFALGFSAWSFVVAAAAPKLAVVETITMRTGVSGQAALGLVDSQTGGLWFVIALVGLLLGCAGALCGVFAPDSQKRQAKYERFPADQENLDQVATWDQFTAGRDPTKR